ncbi:MAG: RNB domain-containing ribonuclease [Polyangiaceae bacterium]|nr:RNB domain-containing ribonuclease [Polyangiaceae bacterium]
MEHLSRPAAAEAERILRDLLSREDLTPEHPPEVEAEAAALTPDAADPELFDLTALPFVTIDEVSSRDLDQAVHIQAEGDGHIVHYAIADASHFVRPGSALFAEALRRGTSYYLPGLVVPMLPKRLSEDVISLGPGVDRRALVFTVRLDREGRSVSKKIERARVRSRAKLAFGHVQAFYDGGALVDTFGAAVTDAAILTSLRELAVVGKRRLLLEGERHVVPFRRVEMQIDLGPRGFIAFVDPRFDIERYNEQISLLCNVTGAELLARAPSHVQPIWRVHEPPSRERLASLASRIAELIAERRLPASFRWSPSEEGLDAYLRRLPEDRVAAAIHRQAMVGGGSALFTAVPGAHAGVGADAYARFTAPMREIVGIFVHGEVMERVDSPFGDEALREQVIESANRARETQRRLDHAINRLVLDALLADTLARGIERGGTVMGVTRDKVHVRLDDPPIDVKVYVGHLAGQRGAIDLSERGSALRCADGSSWALGDAVKLRVLGRDDRDRWELAIR